MQKVNQLVLLRSVGFLVPMAYTRARAARANKLNTRMCHHT
jgi:hypothetical protein